jgi:hypothetical protein
MDTHLVGLLPLLPADQQAPGTIRPGVQALHDPAPGPLERIKTASMGALLPLRPDMWLVPRLPRHTRSVQQPRAAGKSRRLSRSERGQRGGLRPLSRGKAFPWMPVRHTERVAASSCRSSAGGVPPFQTCFAGRQQGLSALPQSSAHLSGSGSAQREGPFIGSSSQDLTSGFPISFKCSFKKTLV